MTVETKKKKKPNLYVFKQLENDSQISGSVYMFEGGGMGFKIGDLYLSFTYLKDNKGLAIRVNDDWYKAYPPKPKAEDVAAQAIDAAQAKEEEEGA